MRSIIAFLAAALFVAGTGGGVAASTFLYTGNPTNGRLAESSKDWSSVDGSQASPVSAPGTTLKANPREGMQLIISIAPDFTTAGRIVVGEAGKLFAGAEHVAWTGVENQPFTLKGSDGKPGEILLESSREVPLEGHEITGCAVFSPLVAPDGLVFGGAGQGPDRKEHPQDQHRLAIVNGLTAGGPATKVGASEVDLYGAVKLDGPLEIQEGTLIVATNPESGEPTRLEIKSARIEPEGRLVFYTSPDYPKLVLALTLGQPEGEALIECNGALNGIDKTALDVLTPGEKPPSPGTYRLISQNHPQGVAEFTKATLNGSALPANCHLNYSPDARSVDLVVDKK